MLLTQSPMYRKERGMEFRTKQLLLSAALVTVVSATSMAGTAAAAQAGSTSGVGQCGEEIEDYTSQEFTLSSAAQNESQVKSIQFNENGTVTVNLVDPSMNAAETNWQHEAPVAGIGKSGVINFVTDVTDLEGVRHYTVFTGSTPVCALGMSRVTQIRGDRTYTTIDGNGQIQRFDVAYQADRPSLL